VNDSPNDDFEVRLAVVFTQLANPSRLHEFYHKILNLPVAKQVGDHWVEYRSGPAELGTNIGVHTAEEMKNDDPPDTMISFEVKNLNNLRARLMRFSIECSDILERERGRFFLSYPCFRTGLGEEEYSKPIPVGKQQ